MKRLTVGELKLLLVGVPDQTPVLIPSDDHSYREASAIVGKAVREGREWTEYVGPEYGQTAAPVEALIIS